MLQLLISTNVNRTKGNDYERQNFYLKKSRKVLKKA